MISRLKQCLYWCLMAPCVWTSMVEATAVQDIEFQALSDKRFAIRLQFSDRPPEPRAYEIAKPARLVLDFDQVHSQLEQKKFPLAFANAQNAVLVSDGARTRLIVNLQESAPFATLVEGNSLTVQIGASEQPQLASQQPLSGFQPAAYSQS